MTLLTPSTDLEKMAAQSRVNSLAVLGTPVVVVLAPAVWLGTPQLQPLARSAG